MERRVAVVAKRGIRRFRANGREMVWVSDITTTTATGSGTSFVLCTPSDWERSAVSGETATIVRVVGQVNLIREMTAVVVSTSRVAFMFMTQDEDAAPLPNIASSANIGSFSDEKSMFSWFGLMRTDTTVIGNFHEPVAHSIPIDIKTKRKITSGQTLDFAFGNSALVGVAPTVRADVLTRTLLMLK